MLALLPAGSLSRLVLLTLWASVAPDALSPSTVSAWRPVHTIQASAQGHWRATPDEETAQRASRFRDRSWDSPRWPSAWPRVAI